MTDLFFKAVGGIVLTVIMCLVLSKQGKEISLLLTIAACCVVAIIAVFLAEPIIQFMEELQQTANLNSDLFAILIKAVGIGMITQIATTICSDAGNSGLGKVLQYLAYAIIVCLCLPLLENLLDLVESILGNV